MILTINHLDKLKLSTECDTISTLKDRRSLSSEFLHISSEPVRPSVPNSTIL